MYGLYDLSGTQAAGANLETLGFLALLGTNRPQIRVPSAEGDVMSVADAVSYQGSLTANVASLSHFASIPKPRGHDISIATRICQEGGAEVLVLTRRFTLVRLVTNEDGTNAATKSAV
jgi:hypothetical protein